MSQNNNPGCFRDPVWQFIGVVVGVIGIIVAITFGLPTFLQAFPPGKGISPAPTFIVVPTATLASTPSTPSPTATKAPPTPAAKPTTTDTYWGLLGGDSLTVDKTLTCGAGCPDLFADSSRNFF